MENPVPSDLASANLLAAVEYIRSKLSCGRPSQAPVEVLSVCNGSVEHERAVMAAIRARFPAARFTLVEAAVKGYAKLSGEATVVAARVEEFEPPGGKRFDIVYSAGLGATARPADPRATLARCLALLSSTGTLLMFVAGAGGVYADGERFRAVLVGKALDRYILPPRALTAAVACELIARAGMAGSLEAIDSQVDATLAMREPVGAPSLRSLGPLIGVDLEGLAERQYPLVAGALEAMRGGSIGGDGLSGRCLLFTPLVAVAAARAGDAPPLFPQGCREEDLSLPACDRPRLRGGVLDQWAPHGPGGGFFNAGLQSWVEARAAWHARREGDGKADDVDSSRRDDLDDCSVDEFVASAIASECPYELPSRMRLSDVIDILCDSWDLDDAL